MAVRLEDIKLNSKVTLGKLCSWMGIDDHDALYNMTAQGLRWWGDPTSPDYHEDGMDPFGRVSLEREVGEDFSEKDQFILRTLFYPFNVQFGYEKIDEHAFIKNLTEIRPLIDEIFDFERSVINKMNVAQEHFMLSGSYHFFRACLRDRWEVLNRFKTYPGMISPL